MNSHLTTLSDPITLHHSQVEPFVDLEPLKRFFRNRPTILACLTLYNEPAHALAHTLIGLVKNQLQLKKTSLDHMPSLSICIMVDGQETLASSTALMLQELGFAGDPQIVIEREGQTLSISMLMLPAREILMRLGEQALPWNGVPIRLVLCQKHHNRGKLDSHAWFFRTLAPLADPEFIVQIDAGSVPEDQCMSALLDHMTDQPHCAAAATNIATPDQHGEDLLLTWQDNDFLWGKISDWPIGHGLDYIEVIPGQCCMLRWSSFRSPEEEVGEGGNPLDVYLDGLTAESLLERNLYLAEDRVLGLAMVEKTGKAIHYVSNARVRTDPCTSLDELLRQRRRWVNSTAAARLVAAGRLLTGWRSTSLGWKRKISLSLSVLFGLYQFLLLLVLPAMSAILFAWGLDNMAVATGDHHAEPLKFGSAIVFLTCWATMLAGMRAGTSGGGSSRSWRSLALYLLIGLSAFGNVVVFLTAPAAFIAVAIMAVVATAAVLQLDSRKIRVWHRWMPVQLLIAPAMNLFLTSYAFANISDVSWGTKGLDKSGALPSQERRWSKLRNIALILWFGITCGLVYPALLIPPHVEAALIAPMLTALCLPTIIASALSLVRHKARARAISSSQRFQFVNHVG